MMRNSLGAASVVGMVLPLLLSSCAGRPTPGRGEGILATTDLPVTSLEPSTSPSPVRATETHLPTQPPTAIPSPTPLPGSVVIPLESLAAEIPWLPLDPSARPDVHFVGFNSRRAPFDDPRVRQAFAATVDRQALVDMARSYQIGNPTAATTITPPIPLSRDLSGEVGISHDPQSGKRLLAEAGYDDPTLFPGVEFLIGVYGESAPGACFNMASAMAEMWRADLGVEVRVRTSAGFQEYYDRLRTAPPEIYWSGWGADANDPDNFLREIFHSGSDFNFGGFSNPEFDRLVEQAAGLSDPAQRLALYIQAERILCETEVAVIPLFHATSDTR